MIRPTRYSSIAPTERLPEWLRRPIGNASELETVQGVVKQQRLHTICEEGRCPNRGECYAAGTATLSPNEATRAAAATDGGTAAGRAAAAPRALTLRVPNNDARVAAHLVERRGNQVSAYLVP